MGFLMPIFIAKHNRKTTLQERGLIVGRIKACVIPAMSEEEFRAWWPRLSLREQDAFVRYETHNIITANGRAQALAYLGNATLSGNVVPFFQYFSVGTGTIAQVSPGDTGMASELFRAAPSTVTVSGNTVSVSTFFGASQANATYTEAGIFGNNATATLNSGTMCAHALYSFTKTSAETLVNAYQLNLN